MTIDLISNGSVVALSNSVATGVALQTKEMLSVYQYSEADSTTVCTDGEPDISNGATAQSTTLFSGAEETSWAGLAVDTTADSGLQWVMGTTVGVTLPWAQNNMWTIARTASPLTHCSWTQAIKKTTSPPPTPRSSAAAHNGSTALAARHQQPSRSSFSIAISSGPLAQSYGNPQNFG